MKNTFSLLLGCTILIFSTHSFSANQVVACPPLSLKQYGKTSYYDARSGRTWNLAWLSQQKPVWDQANIPQTTTCGVGKSRQGIPVTYQCAIFQCKSAAVIATLGQTQALKCFSTYVSTQNTFYCDSFTT